MLAIEVKVTFSKSEQRTFCLGGKPQPWEVFSKRDNSMSLAK